MKRLLLVVVLVVVALGWSRLTTDASPYDTLRAQCIDGTATGIVRLGDGQFTVAYVQLRLFEGDTQIEESLVPVADDQTELAFAFDAELDVGSSYRVTSLGNTPAQINIECAAVATPVGTPAGTPPVATPIGVRRSAG